VLYLNKQTTIMKKIFLIALISCVGAAANAQLANVKWKGTVQMDQQVDMFLNFKTDTLEAITAEDGQLIETMKFSIQDSIVSIWKISGQSECSDTESKYKFEIKEDELTLTVVSDDCPDRSSVLDGSKWKKQ
jgi:hypothetical protein